VPATLQPGFETIRRSKVYAEVARQIERLILKKLQPGDKLPSERELALALGVSRGSIRDAIRSLELLGLAEPRHGVGTIVSEVTAKSVINPLANALTRQRERVSDLLDFRKMLEPPLAGHAAMHASSEDISEMEEILQRQEAKLRTAELAIVEDSEFHYRVALASGNTVVLKLIDTLMGLLRDTRKSTLQVAGRPKKSLAGHRRILAAVKRGDARRADAAMLRHIEEVEEIILNEL
jgi:GntR family transcriptional regulator, transcriptional repressor for pyruvate dehydrogenase complex